MTSLIVRRLALASILGALALVGAGCAKKPVKSAAPPPSAPAPTTPAPTPPTPTPTPTPTPPATPPASLADLRTIYFAYDSFTIDDAARAVLDQNAKLLRDHADWKVVLGGHCDERGSVEYNNALGQKRADAVQQYLTDAGIDAARVKTVSYGKERPADEGHDEAAWAKNRRVEFTSK